MTRILLLMFISGTAYSKIEPKGATEMEFQNLQQVRNKSVEVNESKNYNSKQEKGKANECDDAGGYCLEKKYETFCEGTIENDYNCKSKKDSCCIVDTSIDDMLQILLESNKNQESELKLLKEKMNENHEILLSAVEGSAGGQESLTCSGLFTLVGDSCLFLALGERLTWAAARMYCQGLGADLAVFKDANHYAETLDYVHAVNGNNAAINIWIGGSDEAIEGHWVWITEELMPQGPPFWGSSDGYRVEPSGGRNENCAGLHHPDRYYLHDIRCGYERAPLCQMPPSQLPGL